MNPQRDRMITCPDGISVRVTSTSSSTSVTPRDATLKKRRQVLASLDFGKVSSSSTIELSRTTTAIAKAESIDKWSTAIPWLIFKSKRRTLALFLSIDFLIYLDRGIVPGAHDEFTRFLMKSEWIRQNPELYFGLLQSVFIGGLAISAPILSYMAAASQYPTKYLSIGLVIWIISICGCGVAGICNSIPLLFLFRTLSGVGEGAFIGLVAPMLMDTCSPNTRGIFLGIFYGLMPTGVALGFIGSAALATFSHWSTSFISLAVIASLPIMAIVAFATTKAGLGVSPLKHFAEELDHPSIITPIGSVAHAEVILRSATLSELTPPLGEPVQIINIDSPYNEIERLSPSFGTVLRKFLPSLIFSSLLASGAAQAAVTASLSAFGTAYLLNLGLFRSEFFASTTIGIAGALTGTLGTVIGGLLLRFPLRYHKEKLEALKGRVYGKSNWSNEEDGQQYFDRLLTIRCVTLPLTSLACMAAILTTAAPIMLFFGRSDYFSFASLGCGLALLAMTQSGLNLSIMMTAPEQFRSLAISLFTLGLHIFGDVPGPILVGYLKDRLAPHCRPGHAASDSQQCEGERRKLVVTLIIFLSWTNFVWIGLALTYWKASRAVKSMLI